MWSATVAGAQDLDDQFLGVAIDGLTRDVVAVGYLNAGDDNSVLQDLDWVVYRYDELDLDGNQAPDVVWTATYESAPGASEAATSVAIDTNGDVLVGGWTIDAVTALRRWRVARLSAYDGTLVDEWIGPAWLGDAWVTGVAVVGGRVAISGVIDDGTGPDFAVTLLDQDLDEDGVADAVDACPDDPDKAADTGVCGCNVPDVDTDGDGAYNCQEDCPSDPGKTEPGICGCGEPDDDTDLDGTFDCDDRCPENPDKADDVGECGCDAPDNDTDGDGVVGCRDACSNTPPGVAVDSFGCPLDGTTDETGDTGPDTPPTEDGGGKGCGCDAAPGGGALGELLLLPLLLVRRRR
ncbi:MAG: MYXO-CTERM sorting domain-containing protein [Myxococcota bacterium]